MLGRRAFAVGLTLALTGCATADGGATDDRATADGTDASRTSVDSSEGFEHPWLGDSDGRHSPSPHEPWPNVPDLVVVNHQRSSLTVWITVQGAPWSPPAFQETVSIRSRNRGRDPLSVAIDDVPVVGATSSVSFETAWGRHASYRWDGGSDRRGVRAHFYADDIEFQRVGR